MQTNDKMDKIHYSRKGFKKLPRRIWRHASPANYGSLWVVSLENSLLCLLYYLWNKSKSVLCGLLEYYIMCLSFGNEKKNLEKYTKRSINLFCFKILQVFCQPKTNFDFICEYYIYWIFKVLQILAIKQFIFRYSGSLESAIRDLDALILILTYQVGGIDKTKVCVCTSVLLLATSI